MDLFEYQGKQYFAGYDIPVSPGAVADTAEDAVEAARELGFPVVVKAQVQVGGRGKAGGIQLAGTEEETRNHASNILGMDISGHVVKRLWIERASEISQEYYLSFTLDRAAKLHAGMASSKGGIDIEEVVANDPADIERVSVNPLIGIDRATAQSFVENAGFDAAAIDQATEIVQALYRCYSEGDADLVEINPLILTPDGRVHALDAKVTLDDNASYRHPEWEQFRGSEVLDERETFAREKGLNYIGLDGSVGVIGNGAGLVMSTLDVVNQAGGTAANFLDVGGGAGADVLANAIEVINTDRKVRSIFINIFGGITRCDEVADGIVNALAKVEVKSPIVVRLDGTNAPAGRAILADYQSSDKTEALISLPTMLEAAAKAVQLAK